MKFDQNRHFILQSFRKCYQKDKIAFASSRKTLHFKVQSSLISGFIYLLPKFVRHDINAADMRLMWL